MFKGKYIDLSYITEMGEGEDAFVKDMVGTFLKDAPGILIQMNQSARMKDWKKAGVLAHQFKTSLMFMGIQSLFDTIRHIEKSGRGMENHDSIPVWIDEVTVTCREAIRELNDFLQQGPGIAPLRK